MKNFLKSLGKSIRGALAKNKYVVRWRKKYPRFFGFVGRRLSFAHPYGFYFTIGVALSAIALFYFFVLAQDILVKDPFVDADIRFMNLIAALRDVSAARFLLIFTYAGNWQFILGLGIIAALVLLLLKEKRKLIFLTVGVAGGEALHVIFKLLLHRTRPDIGFSLIPQNGYAFPSGHAALSLIFYGLICYGFLKLFKKRWLKFLFVILTVILIFLIGFSRIYLGVHWVSDVLAGWALGIALLILLVTFFEQRERFQPETKHTSIIPKTHILCIAVSLLVLEGISFGCFYAKHPLVETKQPQSEITVISPSSDMQTTLLTDTFPKYSETIVGVKMEPVSFIVAGSREQVIEIFRKAGWLTADEPHRLRNLYRLAVAAIFNRPYPTAPVTPSFLDAQPNTIAFEKPTATNTVRQRHHIRFWPTRYQWDGVPVWVATASFDDGLRYFITHKIHPDIDTERDFIKNELAGTGLVKGEEQIQLVKPLMGKNQSGDQFFTDGRAYIIFLK